MRRPYRRLLLLLGCLTLALSAPLSAASTPRLYIFVSADMRANAFEKQLEAELPGVDITVFSRIREFTVALGDQPEAVLAQRAVLEAHGLNIDLQGYNGSRATETYVLISAQAPIRPDELQGKTLGAVDILGRKNMESFVGQVLGSAAPKLKYVTHERDLLPLLQFDAAAAALTSETWARRLRTKSQMDLKTFPLSQEVGLPAVTFTTNQGRSALEAKLKSARASFNQALGVTQWR